MKENLRFWRKISIFFIFEGKKCHSKNFKHSLLLEKNGRTSGVEYKFFKKFQIRYLKDAEGVKKFSWPIGPNLTSENNFGLIRNEDC